jgi:hypothetical protein
MLPVTLAPPVLRVHMAKFAARIASLYAYG